jgi:cyclopropane fatty-acyl-phospholipid synthase-like methyltransferase
MYDAFVEKQKRDGVYLSQFFTPDQTAERISELAVDFFGEENNVLDACCGFGQLSKALIEKGFTVEGFDLSENMISLYKNLSDKADVLDFGDYTELFDCIVSNPPYERKELTEFLECLSNQMLTDDGKAILLLPKGFVDKDRPKKLVEVLQKFEILHREDMQEEFARTKINAEIVVIEKVK